MSEPFQAIIKLGGDIPAGVWPGLLEAITEDDPSVGDWDEPTATEFIAMSLDRWVREEVNADTGMPELRLYDRAAHYGQFMAIERFCQAHGVAYDKYVDGRDEYDSLLTVFRPGWAAHRTYLTDATGFVVVSRDEIVSAIRTYETTVANLPDVLARPVANQLLAALKNAIGPDIPELPPFRLMRSSREVLPYRNMDLEG